MKDSFTTKLPRRFAVAGVVLGLSQLALDWWIYKFDPFHLPTYEQAAKMSSYTAPPLYWFFTWYLPMVTCPASFPLGFATLDSGGVLSVIAGILAALINAPIYYCLGLIVAAIWKRVAQSR